MPVDDDAVLLKRFLDSGAQDAFAEIVRRRVGLVYSVALRCTRDVHRAEDATQAVFIQLARHAERLARRPVLLGWFYRAAYNAATDIVRSDRARIAREQEHFTMTELSPTHALTPDWAEFRPIIDDAMQELNEPDRDAVLMRFFDGHSFASIGDRLHLTENSARMRVDRALEKLHAALVRRGVNSTAAIISSAFAAEHIPAVPSGLAEKATAAATTSASSVPLTNTFLTMKAMKLATASTVLFLGAAATILAVRKNEPGQSNDARVPVRATDIGAKTPAVAPAPGLSLNRSAQAVSRFQLGERMSGADMADRGQATARAALETFIWAQEGGDLARLAGLIFLTPDTRAKSEQLFASLAEAQRTQFGNAERMIAAFMIGGTTAAIGTEENRANWAFHQIIGDEAGAKFPRDAALLPKALGLIPAAADDPNYHTFRTKYQLSPEGKGSEPNSVFYRTDGGWKWVIPPSMVDSFSRLLGRETAPTTARKP